MMKRNKYIKPKTDIIVIDMSNCLLHPSKGEVTGGNDETPEEIPIVPGTPPYWE